MFKPPAMPVRSGADATLNWDRLQKYLPRPDVPRFQVTEEAATLPTTAAGGVEKIALATVVYDTAAWWDTINKRYVPQRAGLWIFGVSFAQTVEALPEKTFLDIAVELNKAMPPGFKAARAGTLIADSAGAQVAQEYPCVMNGSTDYVEMYGGTTTVAANAKKGQATLYGYYVGA